MVALLHVRPYLFDREFQDLVEMPATAPVDQPETPVPEEIPPLPPVPSYSAAALAAAREEGYVAGEAAGRAAAERSLAASAARSIEHLVADLQQATVDAAQQRATIAGEATAIALTLCRKLLPHTYRETAGDEIAQLVATVLPKVAQQPRLLVRVATPLVAAVTDALTGAVRTAEFAGTLKVVGDAALAIGDCRIEWAQGGLVRDAAALWREIEITIDQILRPLAPAAVDAFAPGEPMPNVNDLAMQPIAGHPGDQAPEPSTVLINPNQGADANA